MLFLPWLANDIIAIETGKRWEREGSTGGGDSQGFFSCSRKERWEAKEKGAK